MLYSTFTAYLGFAVNEDEYKVMGLAAYGRPTMADQVRKLIRRTPDGAFALDLEYFEFQTTASAIVFAAVRRSVRPAAPLRTSRSISTRAEGRRFADCAASVQRVLEDTLVDIARALHRETGLPDLCLGGGVALNGVANARILAESASSACSCRRRPATPAARWARRSMPIAIYFGNPDRDVPDHPFWGPTVDGQELARVAREDGQARRRAR